MHEDLKTPLAVYSKGFKSPMPKQEGWRKRFRYFSLTDTEYNELVSLLGTTKTFDAYPKRLRVYTSDTSRLQGLLQKTIPYVKKMTAERESSSNAYVRMYFNTTADRNKAKTTIDQIKSGGEIVSYDATNPRIAFNVAGNQVAITEAREVSTTKYQNGVTGKEEYLNEQAAERAKNSEYAAQTDSLKTYVIIGLVVLLLVLFIKLSKK